MSNKTDKILVRTDCFVIYKSADWGPPVPYFAMERSETPDRPNRGFIDLRDNPQAVSEIYEAADTPGLQILLRAVNQPASSFMSLGCDRNLNKLDTPNGGATCYLNSYCQVTYRNQKQQTESNIRRLADDLAEHAGLEHRNWVQVELGIEEMKEFYGQRGGYCLNISVSGYGRDGDEAWIIHEFGCGRIASVFDQYVSKEI